MASSTTQRTALLLNPKARTRTYSDPRTEEIMRKTIDFFESKGKRKLKDDDHAAVWYQDFLDFVKEERIFATLLTPQQYGAEDTRWDTSRFCEFAEILGFYGLPYWYTWQVSILGLGPIWMSGNEQVKQQTVELLENGSIFAFGLSEKEHGADVYSTDMILTPQGDGTYLANGEKYYIGNGNKAGITSTFGKLADTDEYVFFAADSQHDNYELIKNVVHSQSYVSNYRLNDYPVNDANILHRGDDAWNAALNTVNIGKYNLGWASIGIATHAFYEAINHAANRELYGMKVTDFPHVKSMFVDAYARTVAMKLVASRACDYMRTASPEDRRYLLFNPVVKMKVTTQGEEAVALLADVIAAKGFEEDMYFEMAVRDIAALPKLEGTVHVNIALIVKFMASYLFDPQEYAPVAIVDQPTNDDFLFDQGPTRGLSKIKFHDYSAAFNAWDLPNVAIFKEQIEGFKSFLTGATPSQEQSKDIDFLLGMGQLFSLIVYAQLVAERAELENLDGDTVDQIFDFIVRDFSAYALELYQKPTATEAQMEHCLKLIRKPAADQARYERVWQDQVLALNGVYEMNP